MSQIAPIKIHKVNNGIAQIQDDLVAIEEPLEIRLGWGELDLRQQKSLAVTMRTPENDFDLALGFLFTEGIIRSFSDVLSIKYCIAPHPPEGGVVTLKSSPSGEWGAKAVRVELNPNIFVNLKTIERNFYMTSSCGVCGKASIEAIEELTCNLPKSLKILTISKDFIYQLPNLLKNHQKSFTYTGGLHAAALFNQNGDLILLREDIGRHNALDKLIGAGLQQNLNFDDKILLMSSRASFELIQKAVVAQIPIMACIGAASSLAIETAKQFDLTLIGFLREKQFNIYCGEEKIV